MQKHANGIEPRGQQMQSRIHKPALRNKETVVYYFLAFEVANINLFTIFELNRSYSRAVVLLV